MIHLSDCTDRDVDYNVTVKEINVIFFTFQASIFLVSIILQLPNLVLLFVYHFLLLFIILLIIVDH